MITKEQFTEEAAFAKVVETTAGPALLIGGIVIQAQAPGFDAADYLSTAFRRLARGEAPLMGEGQNVVVQGCTNPRSL